jgi:hypothetical protein
VLLRVTRVAGACCTGAWSADSSMRLLPRTEKLTLGNASGFGGDMNDVFEVEAGVLNGATIGGVGRAPYGVIGARWPGVTAAGVDLRASTGAGAGGWFCLKLGTNFAGVWLNCGTVLAAEEANAGVCAPGFDHGDASVGVGVNVAPPVRNGVAEPKGFARAEGVLAEAKGVPNCCCETKGGAEDRVGAPAEEKGAEVEATHGDWSACLVICEED